MDEDHVNGEKECDPCEQHEQVMMFVLPGDTEVHGICLDCGHYVDPWDGDREVPEDLRVQR